MLLGSEYYQASRPCV